jgi:F-type H+-transporting ATPase subunit c
MSDMSAIGAGLAALGVLGPSIGVGLAAFKALEGMARQPEKADDIFTKGLIFAALSEALGIISLLIALKLAGFINIGG